MEGDQNLTPQIVIEEDDDLDEQDVVNEDLAAQPTEDEDHLGQILIKSLQQNIRSKIFQTSKRKITSSNNFKKIQSWIKI